MLTGYLSDEDAADAMAATHIALVPHTYATGSYSVTLPLSHGRVVFASDLDCFQEISTRVDCVELFKAGDAADYKAKLLALLDNPERQAKLAANAQQVRHPLRMAPRGRDDAPYLRRCH